MLIRIVGCKSTSASIRVIPLWHFQTYLQGDSAFTNYKLTFYKTENWKNFFSSRYATYTLWQQSIPFAANCVKFTYVFKQNRNFFMLKFTLLKNYTIHQICIIRILSIDSSIFLSSLTIYFTFRNEVI